jgi:hypothetical protein
MSSSSLLDSSSSIKFEADEELKNSEIEMQMSEKLKSGYQEFRGKMNKIIKFNERALN